MVTPNFDKMKVRTTTILIRRMNIRKICIRKIVVVVMIILLGKEEE